MRILTGGFLAALLAVVALPAPAQAALPGWFYDEESLSNETAEKQITTSCPDGEVAYSIGGLIKPGGAMITGIVPSADLTSVTVYAKAHSTTTGAWSVVARAGCAGQVQIAPTVLERASGSGNGTAVADCPNGLVVYSTGFQLGSQQPSSHITSVVPGPALLRVTVTTAVATDVTSYAVCGPPGNYVVRGTATSPRDSSAAKLVRAGLTADGSVEWGDYVFGGGVAALPPWVYIDGFGPDDTLGGFKVRVFRAGPSWTPIPFEGGLRPALRAASFAVAEDPDSWAATAYSACIGSWYGLPE